MPAPARGTSAPQLLTGKGGLAFIGRFFTRVARHFREQPPVHGVPGAGHASFPNRIAHDAPGFLAMKAIPETTATDDEIGEGFRHLGRGAKLHRELADAGGVDDAQAVRLDQFGRGRRVPPLAGLGVHRARFGSRRGDKGGENRRLADAGVADDGARHPFQRLPEAIDSGAVRRRDREDGDPDLDKGIELGKIRLEVFGTLVKVGLVDDHHRPRPAPQDRGEVTVDETRMKGRGDDAHHDDDDVHVGHDRPFPVAVDRVLAGQDRAAFFHLTDPMPFAVRFDDHLIPGCEGGLLALGDFAGEGALEILPIQPDAAALPGDVDDGAGDRGRGGGFLKEVESPLLHAPAGTRAPLILLGLRPPLGGRAGDLLSLFGRNIGQPMT